MAWLEKFLWALQQQVDPSEGNDIGIAGIMPEGVVWVVKAFDAEGRTTTNALADGVADAVARGARVINLSGGQFRGDAQDPLLLDFIDYRTAIAGLGIHETVRQSPPG